MGLPEKFHALFVGLPAAHGTFRPRAGATADQRGKLKGQQATVRAPPTPALWASHLAGEVGLGVFPLREDGTVRFAAIDVDVYQLDHARLYAAVAKFQLPLAVCRSKSGGAHLYLFGREDLPAGLVRRRLAGWAGQLGLHALIRAKADKVELFPVTDALGGGLGNYLNMPYFGKERWGVGKQGKLLSPEAFLASIQAVTLKQLRALGDDDAEEPFKDGPPCLQALAAAGPITAYRDNALVDIGAYLRRAWPDGWQAKLEEYNRRLFPEPLTAAEVVKTIKSLERKTYNYMCAKEPIASRCQRKVCLGRRHGVRAVAEANGQEVGFNLNLGPLTKFDITPPLWEWEVDGQVLRMSTEQLLVYRAFRRLAVERLNRLPVTLKQESWDEIVAEKLAHVLVVEAPADAGVAGQVRFYLEVFCTQHQATREEELKLGRAWWTTDGQVLFRAPHFMEFLARQRVAVQPTQLASHFRAWGFTHHNRNVQGAYFNYWAAPAWARQTEPDPVPRPGRDNQGRF